MSTPLSVLPSTVTGSREAVEKLIEFVKYCFIINPISGGRSKRRIEALIDKRFKDSGLEFEIHHTEYPGHAKELAAGSNAEIVVAVGGDGTVHEVASGIIGTDKILGIIPCGSGNGLALHCRISRNPGRATDTLLHRNIIRMDCGIVNGEPFFCTCGVGIDALVSAGFEGSKRGLLTYIQKALKVWKHFTPGHYSIEIDGIREELDAAIITVGNVNQWGNNAYICPEAVIDDGLLDVTIVKPFRSLDIPGLALKLLCGRLPESRKTILRRGRAIQIGRKPEPVFQIDGETKCCDENLEICIAPQAVNIIISNYE